MKGRAKGHIFMRPTKLGVDRWYASWRDAAGRQRQWAIGESRSQAEEFLRLVHLELEPGHARKLVLRAAAGLPSMTSTYSSPHEAPLCDPVSYDDFVTRYLEARKAEVVPGTLSDIRYALQRRLGPELCDRNVGDLTSGAIRQARDALLENYARKTINTSLGYLSAALNWAADPSQGMIAANPIAASNGSTIQLPEGKQEMLYLKAYQVPIYLAACAPHYRLLAEVAIATGLRVSELIGLNNGDLDVERRRIIVVRQARGDQVRQTKGKRPRGCRVAESIVSKLVVHRHSERARFGHAGEADPIFRSIHGRRFDRTYLSRDLHKKAVGDAKLDQRLRFHDLRHTTAALMLGAGCSLMAVSLQLGHRSITTTIDTYGHLEDGVLAHAPEAVERLIARDVEAEGLRPSPTVAEAPTTRPGVDRQLLDNLERLHELHQAGAIEAEEFAALKAELLAGR